MSVTFEQNIGEQDREGQQKNRPNELDSPNIGGNSTRQPFDASNTLDTNVINSHGMFRIFYHYKCSSKSYIRRYNFALSFHD